MVLQISHSISLSITRAHNKMFSFPKMSALILFLYVGELLANCYQNSIRLKGGGLNFFQKLSTQSTFQQSNTVCKPAWALS
jgi:hypothetical protein